MSSRFAFAVLLALALAGTGRTDVITFGPQPFTLGPGQSVTLLFPQFDPALGELTPLGVAWRGTAHTEGQIITFDNERPDSFDGLVLFGASVKGTAPGIAPELPIAFGRSHSTVIALPPDSDPGPPDFTGSDSIQLANPGADSDLPGLFPPPSSFPSYVGTGTVAFDLGDFQTSVFPPVTLASRFDNLGFVSGTVSLSYEFEPTAVPEPATFILVGLAAMAGAGLRCAKRQRHNC